MRSFLRRVSAQRAMWERLAIGAGVTGIVATSIVAYGIRADPGASRASAEVPAATTEEAAAASMFEFMGLPPAFGDGYAEGFASVRSWLEVAIQPTPTATATQTPVPPPPPTATATSVPVAPRPARPVAPRPLPPTPTPAPPPPAPPATSGLNTAPMDALSQALFDATNRRRVASGLAPLRPNGYVTGVARIRSDDMARHDYFAHTSPVTGDTAFSLMDAYGVPYAWAGENLAMNNYADHETVAVADQALWDSPPHRENILNPHYTDAGIAVAYGRDGIKYFTIIFTGS